MEVIDETAKRRLFQEYCDEQFSQALTSHTVSREYLDAVKLHIIGCNPAAVKRFCDDSNKKLAKFKFKVKERKLSLINVDGEDTVVVPRDRKEFEKKENVDESDLQPLACVDDFYDIIKDAHEEVGHQGSRSTYKLIQQKYAGVPRKAVLRFLQMCEVCRLIEPDPSESDPEKRFTSPVRRPNAKKLKMSGSFTSSVVKTGALKAIAVNKINGQRKRLYNISQEIWKKPELNYKEHFAHDTLCAYLEEHGFDVERSYCGIDTAFAAGYALICPENHSERECNIALLCEYDALPELGHACGHNLIAEIGVGAAVGVKTAMLQSAESFNWPYSRLQVTVIGCPAEEGGGGKIKLLEAGAFSKIDAVMMAHPATVDVVTPKLPAIKCLQVDYHGRASHACSAPWEGVNALDAAVQAYTSLSSLRQQLPPDTRLACIITEGGKDAGVIPAHAVMKVSFRALGQDNLEMLSKQVESCLISAATSSRCKAIIKVLEDSYEEVLHNTTLASIYSANCDLLGSCQKEVQNSDQAGLQFSTDFGDVSIKVPGIHPVFSIGTRAPNHTEAFAQAAGSEEAQEATIDQAKALAWTALDLLTDAAQLDIIRTEFNSFFKPDDDDT